MVKLLNRLCLISKRNEHKREGSLARGGVSGAARTCTIWHVLEACVSCGVKWKPQKIPGSSLSCPPSHLARGSQEQNVRGCAWWQLTMSIDSLSIDSIHKESVQLGGFVKLFWELWRVYIWMATPQRAVLSVGVSHGSKGSNKERTGHGLIPLEEQSCHLPPSSGWHLRTRRRNWTWI